MRRKSSKEQSGSTRERMGITRRGALTGGAALAVGYGIAGFPAVHAQARTIAVTCWGGVYEDAIRQVFAEPFTAETGIGVTLINNADLARMKVQVESRNVSWDVFDSVGPQIMAGVREGLWEPLDLSIIEVEGLNTPAGEDHVGFYYFAGGTAFDPQRMPEGREPSTFADFWDIERFPGRRGLRTRVSETLELALLADGVAPEALYPLDVERGFAALDRIKPHVRRWIEATPETVTLIASNELDFTYSYLSRVLPARRAGTSIALAMGQTLNSLEYLAVPRNGRNTREAMEYVAFCLRPDRQAAFCEVLEFTPNVDAAMELVSDEARARMPNMNDPNSVVIDDAWWGEHYDALQRRFTEWMLL